MSVVQLEGISSPIECRNDSPISGSTIALGFDINWAQTLPADLCIALINRLEYLQITLDAKRSNMQAIECIRDALNWLEEE